MTNISKQPAVFSCGTGYTNIGVVEADQEALAIGADRVCDWYATRIRTGFYGRTEVERSLFIRYYFKNGMEVAHYSYGLSTYHHNNSPVQWSDEFAATLSPDKFYYVEQDS